MLQKELQETLESLRGYPKDWNSYGSQPISEATLSAAAGFFAAVEKNFSDVGIRLLPSPNGIEFSGCAIDFWTPRRSADIEFFHDGDLFPGVEILISLRDRETKKVIVEDLPEDWIGRIRNWLDGVDDPRDM